MARTESNIFAEYVGKDSKGRGIVQSDIHKEIQWHIDECKRRKLENCGILAPWGHGKTEQVLFRVLDEIGKDPNIRIQIICNTDDNSTARVSSLAKYIEEDPEYRKVYPHAKPSPNKKDDWGKHKLTVERTSRAKDGTVEAWGITTSGTGSRADLQIFDDPVDLRNAVLNPALREQVKESLRNVWFSRLVPGGMRIYIATLWHTDDATSELLKNPEWKWLVMKVSEDFSCIKCSSAFKGEYTIPLWNVWNEGHLRAQYRKLGQRAFNRGYRQEALSSEDMTFPNYAGIFRDDVGKDMIGSDWTRVIGIDPFGQQVVICVLALNPSGGSYKRVVEDIRLGKWDPKRTITEIRKAYLDYMPQVMVCENNASQEAIVQWASEMGWEDMPLVPFCTGAQKADPELGLPSLDVEFANGAWTVPMRGVDRTDSEHPFNIFFRELGAHPVGEAADTVMASWFAREGARLLRKMVDEQGEQQVFSQEEVLEVERVQIGAY